MYGENVWHVFTREKNLLTKLFNGFINQQTCEKKFCRENKIRCEKTKILLQHFWFCMFSHMKEKNSPEDEKNRFDT